MLGASNSRLISPLIRREILKDPEVEAVLSFAVSQSGRQLSIQATVRTSRGDTLSLSEVGVSDLEDLKLLDYQRIQDGYFRLVNEDEL